MNKLLKNAILFGMGAVYYSKEKIEEVIKDLNDENITPEESKKFVQEVMSKADEYRKVQEKEIRKTVAQIIKDFNLATKEDIEKFSKKTKTKATSKTGKTSKAKKAGKTRD
jgi:polyhydroxyalkanoate synthesis regulator phasin